MIKSRLSAQAAPGLIPLMQANSSQGSPGHQMAVPHPGGLTHSLSALSIPSVPLSPISSTPATPATPSTVTSASGHEVTSSLSMLGRRESKESAAMARAETKRLKAEQVVECDFIFPCCQGSALYEDGSLSLLCNIIIAMCLLQSWGDFEVVR